MPWLISNTRRNPLVISLVSYSATPCCASQAAVHDFVCGLAVLPA
jgi:hypothetical protein